MARTLAFDRESAIRAAREVFWRDGYATVSLPALEAATGLSRSSIYNSFGSKRGLFDAAVQSYLDDVIRPRLRPLQQANVTPTALADYLDGLQHAFSHASPPPGCLLVNTASTPLAEDDHVAEIIAAYRSELHAAIGNGVRARFPDADVHDHTRMTNTVTDLIVAAFALVRVAPSVALGTLATAQDTIARQGSGFSS